VKELMSSRFFSRDDFAEMKDFAQALQTAKDTATE